MNDNSVEKLYDYKNSIAKKREKASEIVHKMQKYTARERLLAIFDEDTFVETNAFVKCIKNEADEAVATGYGAIGGKLVFAFAQDPIIDNGAMSVKTASKICSIINMAVENNAPVIAVFDSNGGRIEEGLSLLNAYGTILHTLSCAKDLIPIIAAIAGTCAGIASLIAKTADFVFMSAKKGEFFINSPQIMKAVTGKVPEEAATAYAAFKNGNVNIAATDEGEMYAAIKKLISYLPQNYIDGTDIGIIKDEAERITYELTEKTDTRSVLFAIADNSEIFELSKAFAPNIITAFIRLNGVSVGVVANNTELPSITPLAAFKAAKFISFCDAFSIPILTLVDTDGFEFSAASESGISSYSTLSTAYSTATSAKITLITGKAYGAGYIAMGSKALGADIVYAMPFAKISVMEPSAAAIFLFEEKLKNSENPISEREKLIDEYKAEFASPYRAAFDGYVDNILSPENTRAYIISAVEALAFKNKTLNPKKRFTL